MIGEIQALVDDYLRWLGDNTALRQLDDWVEITTPCLDRHNDCLQIYVKRDADGYLLSDDGYILDDLEASGCRLDTEKRQALLQTILNGFGARLDNDRKTIVIGASKHNFSLQKHNIIQAMLAVNDMFYLSSPHVRSLFVEDVARWFDKHDIRYTVDVKFTGKSGYDHRFEFAIPKSRRAPERVVRAINAPRRDNAQNLAFAWLDTREVRPPASRAYAFLNDAETDVQGPVLRSMQEYDVRPIPWSRRERYRDELAA